MNNSEVAKLIVSEIYGSPHTYLFLCLAVTLSGLAAWALRYLERKAENYVTREDFEKLQEQLAASTRLVESVKSEVQHSDWARREWFAFRSKKLEALMDAVNALAGSMVVLQQMAIRGETIVFNTEMQDNVISVVRLYFPELESPMQDFVTACLDWRIALGNASVQQQQDEKVDWVATSTTGTYRIVIDTQRKLHEASAQLLRQSAIKAGFEV